MPLAIYNKASFTELHMAAHVKAFRWAYKRGIPLQNIRLKEGGGLIFEMSISSTIYSTCNNYYTCTMDGLV